MTVPEALTPDQITQAIIDLKEYQPELFSSLVDVEMLTEFQKLLIVDNLLLDHPDIYLQMFRNLTYR
jgi:hypothetical protein